MCVWRRYSYAAAAAAAAVKMLPRPVDGRAKADNRGCLEDYLGTPPQEPKAQLRQEVIRSSVVGQPPDCRRRWRTDFHLPSCRRRRCLARRYRAAASRRHWQPESFASPSVAGCRTRHGRPPSPAVARPTAARYPRRTVWAAWWSVTRALPSLSPGHTSRHLLIQTITGNQGARGQPPALSSGKGVWWYTEGGDKEEGVRGEREPPAFSNYFKHCWQLRNRRPCSQWWQRHQIAFMQFFWVYGLCQWRYSNIVVRIQFDGLCFWGLLWVGNNSHQQVLVSCGIYSPLTDARHPFSTWMRRHGLLISGPTPTPRRRIASRSGRNVLKLGYGEKINVCIGSK